MTIMMSEDIHKWTNGRYTLMFDEHTFFVWDNEDEKEMTALQVTKKLNELAEENEQLRRIEVDFYGLLKGYNLLTKKIRKIKEIVKETDYFSDEATKHDTIAYREMHSFDNKDAHAIACAFKKIMEILE